MAIWLYIVIALVVLWGIYCYWLAVRWLASRLIMIFVAQSLLIRNIHVDSRPRFIMQQCETHKHELHWLFRRPSMWYIRRSGIAVATGLLTYIVTDARQSHSIETME